MTKSRVPISHFSRNPADYLSNPDDVSEFFTALEKTDGWFVGEVSPFELDSQNHCWTGTIRYWTAWDKIADQLNTMKIPCLSGYEFY